MSEHYDFHYQPTGSGAISGQQVLQQTEDAINELGDYVNDNVGGAMDVAQEALETAQNAEQDAQTALDTANSFSSAIQSAQQDASTALSTAQTAQTTATNASNTAIQASQDANTAVTTANNASGQVSTLSGTVTALGQRVTTAEGNIGQNTSDITALTTRVGTAEGNITTLQNDVTIAQGNASSAMATAGQVKQQAFVFRYSSTALVASSTNSNTLLDNTDNLKVGDKVIDSSGVLFSITAIDTQNSTFTIGTALIDLAQDSDVVHKSGDETVAGFKEFANIRATNSIKGINLDSTTTDLNNCYSDFSPYGENKGGNIQYYYCNTDAGTANISNLPEAKAFFLTSITTRLISNSLYVKQTLVNSTNKTYTRYCNNGTWSSWVNETDSEYVHKSGDETVAGVKTFINYFLGKDLSGQTVDLNDCVDAYGGAIHYYYAVSNYTNISNKPENKPFILESKTVRYVSSIDYIYYQKIYTTDYNAPPSIYTRYYRSGSASWSSWIKDTDKFVTTDTAQTISGNKTFSSINGVEPSSLSLPSGNVNDVIDISSYITALDGTSNSYTVPGNGWISIAVVGTAIAIVSSSWSDSRLRESSGNVRMLYPVLKNETLGISVIGTTLAYARFIPCQGNV